MWLLGRLAPDHKTIADFRKDNGLALRKVCYLHKPLQPDGLIECLRRLLGIPELFSRDLKQPTARFYKPIDSSSRRPPLGSADVGVHSGKCFANRVSFDLYAAGFCWIT